MVLRELSLMLLRDLKDPRLRGITLTGVKMTDDLRHGRVFFSHLEGQSRATEAIAGFKSASGFIRRQVGRALGMRYAPELEFEFDPGPSAPPVSTCCCAARARTNLLLASLHAAARLTPRRHIGYRRRTAHGCSA